MESLTKSSMGVSTLNLMKNCVGAGVFSLSAKLLSVSSISNQSLIPRATFLIFLLAISASYSFYTVAETCRLTGVSTYGDCWAETVSPKSRWFIQTIICLGPLIACLANTIVLTDLLAAILQSLNFPLALCENRVAVAMLLCGFIIYPLCSVQDLKALQSSSILGFAGQVVAMVVVAVRAADKSYLPGGMYAVEQMHIPQVVAESGEAGASLFRWFVFTSLLSYCFVAHYNAPKYFTDMENPTQSRMMRMTLAAYLGAAVFYALSMWLGVMAFGSTCKPYLLNNLAPRDPLSMAARISVAASILASTPLMFMNVRNWLINASQQSFPVLASTKPMAAALVIAMGVLATQFTDISVLGSVAGGLLGTNMMFTIPPIMYIRALQKRSAKTGSPVPLSVLVVNVGISLAGFILSAVGTFHSVKVLFR